MTNPERMKVLKSIFMAPKLIQIRQHQIVVEVSRKLGREARETQTSFSKSRSISEATEEWSDPGPGEI